jgi:hypothetical protein
MVRVLETLSQRLAGHDLVVVASGRTGSRPAVQAPDMSSPRLPAAEADRFNPTRYPVIGMTRDGLRAGRSVGSGGSLRSRRLAVRLWCHGPVGRTHQTAKRQGTSAGPVK